MVISEKQNRIVVKGYKKRYGESELFRSLDMEIKEGELVCIIGPNGCGKSTFIKSIANLMEYDGKIETKGTIGLVGQNQEEMLLPWLSVKSNILFPKKEREIDSKLFADLVSITNLQDYMEHFPSQLSGGMQQLVLIARALLHNSEIILLDEPFKSLDFQMAKKIQLKVLELWSIYRPTILMVSHDIDESIFMADRVLVFSEKPTKVKRVINVELPRERDLSTIASGAFNKIKREVINELTKE